MSYLVFGDDNRMNEVRRILAEKHCDGATYVFAPNVKLTTERIFDLPYNAVVYAGGADDRARDFARKNGMRLLAYEDEKFLTANARLTAEGVLIILLTKVVTPVRDNKILLVGCGRCGRAIAKYLYALGADFEIMTSRPDCAELYTTAINYGADISRYDVVINTAPSRVISARQLDGLKREAVIIDISSPPYGLDHEYAINAGLDSAVYPALPARYRWKAAAEALAAFVLEEKYE